MQYRYDGPRYEYEPIEKDQSTKKQKVVAYQESIEVKNEHIFQQTTNEMYENIENGACFNIHTLQKILIKNTLIKYNKTQTAKILGISIRTLRNKIKEYGLKDVQPNKGFLH